ncbi:unnamed protein product [Pneumocystis jirovecii]|uniref:Suppressor of forked domain-containing protein n=2 Tax=Pneumocystis jirovecii TaxID=42068 RepID=L0PDB9_PNEJI|nr:uncharacterized protein T551_02956 [Pneumocystis jirovecii RU7]KTW27457.1 hypothetical protein T551_02956 [Pneumocystis jirovecii RU7]CCJ30227.1 unnamed protein product [Pneumocystis jirovecii]
MNYNEYSGHILEEETEYERYSRLVKQNSDDFESWEALIRIVETADGGLNRNSSPQAIGTMRNAYDRFLTKFPLLFGYWRKYAELEFSIAGTEAAEIVYERGVAGISNSVDLWTNYCGFKMETSHDAEETRELFERGATHVGLDFLSHPFWDKYIEFEERMEAPDRIFMILDRVIHIPMHQYARYFERYTQVGATRPISELLPPDILNSFRRDVLAEPASSIQAGQQQIKMERGELEIERETRMRIHNLHLEIFNRTQVETTRRWVYEAEIRRPYFHITELDEAQLVNWRKYLDFEETEGNFKRIQFLYERCLVACALYDEFWFRYVRWMSAQENKEEEVRLIYQRACSTFVPVCRPAIRHQYAYFEEQLGHEDISRAMFESILVKLPGHIETIISWVNMERRLSSSIDNSIAILKRFIDSNTCDIYAKAALTTEWIRLIWKCKGSVDEAREMFQKNAPKYLDSRYFWINYLMFEMEQPVSPDTAEKAHCRILNVITQIRKTARLPPLVTKDLTHIYMVYLLERAPISDAILEYNRLDREVNGPFSVQIENKQRLSEDGDAKTYERKLRLTNGHPGVEINEADIRAGKNPYDQYYIEQGEIPPITVGHNAQQETYS